MFEQVIVGEPREGRIQRASGQAHLAGELVPIAPPFGLGAQRSQQRVELSGGVSRPRHGASLAFLDTLCKTWFDLRASHLGLLSRCFESFWRPRRG